MTGQHLYLRYSDGLGNAGTWTAALTPGLLDRDQLKRTVEPGCLLDESFSRRCIGENEEKSVLRIYRLGQVMVCTRIFWVTDIITEKRGRKTAYAHSLLFSKEDAVRFIKSPSLAFDPGSFLKYPAVAEAMLRGETGESLFSPEADLTETERWIPDPGLLQACGIRKNEFRLLIRYIYFALKNGKELGVLLPEPVRRAWENTAAERAGGSPAVSWNGDPAERLAQFIFMLLPEYSRADLAICTHRGCRSAERSDESGLVFLHPESESDLIAFQRSGGLLFSVEDRQDTVLPESPYADFLFDHLGNYGKITELWEMMKKSDPDQMRAAAYDYSILESLFLSIKKTEII